MQEEELLKYGKYISSVIASVIRGTATPAPFDDINWKKLFNIAQKHSVAVIIYPAIKNCNIPDEDRALFVKHSNKMLARATRQAIEAEKVFSVFEDNDIKFIKLKGIHLKTLYPYSYMRTFGDIDVYVNDEDMLKAQPLMQNMGYTMCNHIDYEDVYSKDKFYFYELHSHIVPKDVHYSPIFDNPFDKAVADSDSNKSYVLNNEYFYLNLFFHLHKHFTLTGCGIRLFADLLVFHESVKNADFKLIDSILDQYKMLEFKDTVYKLMECFFDGKDFDETTKPLALYIFENETNGIYKYHVANFGFFGKVGYFLKNWFPSAKNLAFRYPVLEKYPVLLPVCWIRRIFYTLFFKRSALKEQKAAIKEVNSDHYKKIKEIRKAAEIKK